MRTHLLARLALCTCAAVTLSAQIGVQLPGMGRRSPGGNGRQQGTQKKADNSIPSGPVETLTGSLREISSTSLTVDTGDDTLVLVQISTGTKYMSTMDKVKASDFEPGDHVTVEAVRDTDDHYHSKTVTMNKKGTAEDKAAAMAATKAASASASSAAGGSDDPDRPRMRRADSESAPAPAPATKPAPASVASNSDNSDRPRLRRADSNSEPAPAPAPAPRPAAPSIANSGQPVIITGADSVGSSTVSQSAGRRPAVYVPADSTPSVAANPDRPVLARAPSAASAPSPPASDTPNGPSGRPTLSATDDNGVTRLPPIEPPDRIASNDRQRGVVRGDPVIEQARDEALTFSETLPNYVVKRVTNRFQTGGGGGRGGRTGWQALDVVTADLTYLDGKENYTNVLVNGRATRSIEQTGSWSEGEFGSMLQAILSPVTNADFRNQKATMIGARATYRYDYTVSQPASTWTLHADSQTFSPGYTGSIWVDKATYRVLRIEIAARDLPRNFPLDTAESSIDYDFVMIADKKVLLPTHAEALSCTRGTADCTRNVTDFRNYRKYGADSSISFEGEK